MSNTNRGGFFGLTFWAFVMGILLGAGLMQVRELDRAFDRLAGEVNSLDESLGALEEKIGDAPDSLTEAQDAVDALEEEVSLFAEGVQAHVAQDAERDAELSRSEERRRSEQASAMAVSGGTISPLFLQGTHESGCLEGCDLGGAPRNVPQGVLIPWRDEAYKTTRENLRYRFVDADRARVSANTGCAELVDLMGRPNPAVKVYSNKDGYIKTLGRFREGTVIRSSELFDASMRVWLSCDFIESVGK